MRLEADMTFTDMPSPYSEKTLYFEVDKAHGDMLADDTYDAFVLVPLYLAMYHKQDLHIRGNISKKLYQNIKWYIPRILCDFSDDLVPIKFTVDGFTSPKRKGNLIGASLSCGVDSLSTIYDHFVKETDPDYRINSLFLFNGGSNGDYENPRTFEIFKRRCHRAALLSKEFGLLFCFVNTNLHAFRHRDSATHKFKMGNDYSRQVYLASYSCIFSLQNAIFRYYMSDTLSYSEIKDFEESAREYDLAEFCESYFVPLIQTERTELIVDGCQYRRVDKVKNLADWDFARRHLDVCWNPVDHKINCGVCPKCLRTLLPLEILGKLDKFSRVFNIEQYRRNSFNYKIRCLQNYGEDPFETENVDFAREHNFPMPTKRDCYVLGNQATIV